MAQQELVRVINRNTGKVAYVTEKVAKSNAMLVQGFVRENAPTSAPIKETEKETARETSTDGTKSIANMSAKDAIAYINSIDDEFVLNALLDEETANKNRKTVKTAIETEIANL